MTGGRRLATAGLLEVTLPSGISVRGRLPTVDDLWVRQIVPDDLLGVVMKFAGGADMTEIPEDEKPLYFKYLRLLVSQFPREERVGQKWVPVALTVEDTFTMDPRDIDELEYLVLRLKTADQISAVVKAELGLMTKEEATSIVGAEMPKTMGGWVNFRRFIAGTPARPNGEDVGQSAVVAARPNRASRRARPGRGAGGPAVRRRQAQASP